MTTFAFFAEGQGSKEIVAGGANAVYKQPLPIGTFAVIARIQARNRINGLTVVQGALSFQGGALIGPKTTNDLSTVLLKPDEAETLVLHAVLATNASATVFLQCGVTTGRAEISAGRITTIQLKDPNALTITKPIIESFPA
jgi:hypothetical protein